MFCPLRHWQPRRGPQPQRHTQAWARTRARRSALVPSGRGALAHACTHASGRAPRLVFIESDDLLLKYKPNLSKPQSPLFKLNQTTFECQTIPTKPKPNQGKSKPSKPVWNRTITSFSGRCRLTSEGTASTVSPRPTKQRNAVRSCAVSPAELWVTAPLAALTSAHPPRQQV